MSDFKVKMHQIRFPLGGAYSAPPADFRGLLLRGWKGKGRGQGRRRGMMLPIGETASEGGEGEKARRGDCVGASGHFFVDWIE